MTEKARDYPQMLFYLFAMTEKNHLKSHIFPKISRFFFFFGVNSAWFKFILFMIHLLNDSLGLN